VLHAASLEWLGKSVGLSDGTVIASLNSAVEYHRVERLGPSPTSDAANPAATVKINLRPLAAAGGRVVQFAVDEFSKHCLLNGVDELGYMMQQEPSIAAFEAKRAAPVSTLQ
jgi:hypothetical protein